MEIQQLRNLYAKHPSVKALKIALQKDSNKNIQLSGLQGSCTSVVFSALFSKEAQPTNAPFLFVLNDEEEAGYFYHDLVQILGDKDVLFFPSSF